MIYSMTGFGNVSVETKAATFAIEMKSLNHKFFDIAMRLAPELSILEERLRGYLKKKIRRGKIFLSVSYCLKTADGRRAAVNIEAAKRYKKMLLQLKKELKLSSEIGVMDIAVLPEVIGFKDEGVRFEPAFKEIEKGVKAALEKLLTARKREGMHIYKELIRRLKTIDADLAKIRKRIPMVIRMQKERIRRSMEEFSSGGVIDKERCEAEAAAFARNSDISEELSRLKAHTQEFRAILRKDEAVGRSLDFLAQEMYRESNTIGSKSSDFKIAQSMINLKSEIDKIREQVQNVE